VDGDSHAASCCSLGGIPVVNPETESEPVRPRSDTETVKQTAGRPVDRRGIVTAAVPLFVLGGIATAYGFLEGKGSHPSLKLGGAFLMAGLAAITVLLGRSTLLRNSPDVRAIQLTVFVGRDRRDILRISLAFLSVAAALVHFAVIEQHFTEYWLYGAFFVAVGLFELIWALLVMAAPSPLLYWASIVVNTLTIAAYVITRTVGLLVGPSAHETEKIGFGDLTATAFEAVLVVGSLLLLFRSWGRGRVRTAMSEALIGTVAVGVMALTVLALFSTVGGVPFVTPAG
jgi:hypothetical protein